MATLRDIKRRRTSVQGIQQITKAMQMVAAAKLRRAQQRLLSSRAYMERLSEIVKTISAYVEPTAHPFLFREEKRQGELITITADRGLCGGFNLNVIQKTASFLAENQKRLEGISVKVIGKKGRDFFKGKREIVPSQYSPGREVNIGEAKILSGEVKQRYLKGEIDEVNIIYTRFISSLRQEIRIERILPIEIPPETENRIPLFIFEPTPKEILEMLLPHYIDFSIFMALQESLTSEYAARMISMDSATRNAQDMNEKLTLMYNRTRQEAITTELMDIVGGAEALKK